MVIALLSVFMATTAFAIVCVCVPVVVVVVVSSAGTLVRVVDMTVCNFLGGGGADIADGDVEGEGFSGKGMVGVNGDGVAFDGNDDDIVRAVRAGCLETHAGLDVGTRGKNRAIHLSDPAFIAQAVGLDGWHGDCELFPGGPSIEGLFQSGNDAGGAVDVRHGIAALRRAVEEFRAAVADFVVK